MERENGGRLIFMEIILVVVIVYSILKRLERMRYRKHTKDIGIRYLDILADVDSKYILCIGLTIQLVATTCSLAVIKFICEWSKGIGLSFASTLAVLLPLLIQLLLFGLFEMAYKIAYNEDVIRYNLTKKRIPLYYFIGISLIVSNTILNSIGTISLMVNQQYIKIYWLVIGIFYLIYLTIWFIAVINAVIRKDSKLSLFLLKVGL